MSKRREPVIVNGNINRKAKRRVRDIADDLWGWAVREDWGHKCAVCKQPGDQPHHLVPRQFYRLRYDMMNGICLCYVHHEADPEYAPHKNAAGWMSWLLSHHPTRYWWYCNTIDEFGYRDNMESRTIEWYCDVIRGLRDVVEPDDFERIVGVKFAAWLDNAGSVC